MRSAPPKTLGGYRTQNFTPPPPVTGGAQKDFSMLLNKSRVIFLYLCVAGPGVKKPLGGIELKIVPPSITGGARKDFSMLLNRSRVIFLYLCVAGPIGHFWS